MAANFEPSGCAWWGLAVALRAASDVFGWSVVNAQEPTKLESSQDSVVSTCRLPSILCTLRRRFLPSLPTTTKLKRRTPTAFLVERFQARAQAANFTIATTHCLVLLHGSHSRNNPTKSNFELLAHLDHYDYTTRVSLVHLTTIRGSSQ